MVGGVTQQANTQLHDFYDAIGVMTEQEQTDVAESQAKDVSPLLAMFQVSVSTVAGRPATSEPFYDTVRKDPPAPTELDALKSTFDFASHLCGGHACSVKNAAALDFRYVDREIFPARTKGEDRSPVRRLDFLLVNSQDGMPVLAELKIEGDRLAHFALVQVLMHAAELQSAPQRKRLLAHPGNHDFRPPADGPFVDLYLIAYGTPKTRTYRDRSFKATEQISEALIKNETFSHSVRRIAYIEASANDGTLEFEKRFAFGSGV